MIDVVDAMTWIRSRPQQFFGRETPGPIHLLAYIMADVVELGMGECVIRNDEKWWIIGSNVDWMQGDFAVVELFSRVVPAPAHGEHSMRGEILVGVFASDVAVLGASGLIQIKGEGPSLTTLERAAGLKQAVLFRA